MGVEIRWDLPDPDTTWNQVRIYRATSQAGTYSIIATRATDPPLYYDIDGTTSHWYKIAYYDSSNLLESTLSTAVQGGTGISDTNYTHVKDVIKFLNLFTEVTDEAIGTGDGTTTVFYLDNKKVVQNTDVIKVAGVKKVRNADYILEDDIGTITWSSAPTTGSAITGSYNHCDISSSEIKEEIRRAEEEIDQKVGRSFYPSQSVTEVSDNIDLTTDMPWFAFQVNRFIDEAQKTLPQAPEYYLWRTIKTKKWPIIDVTSVTIGTTLLDPSYYDVINDIGVILIKKNVSSEVLTKGEQNTTVVYTYGYTRPPKLIQRLATLIAARNVIYSRLLGSPVALAIPAANITALNEEVERLYDAMGRRLELHRV